MNIHFAKGNNPSTRTLSLWLIIISEKMCNRCSFQLLNPIKYYLEKIKKRSLRSKLCINKNSISFRLNWFRSGVVKFQSAYKMQEITFLLLHFKRFLVKHAPRPPGSAPANTCVVYLKMCSPFYYFCSSNQTHPA